MITEEQKRALNRSEKVQHFKEDQKLDRQEAKVRKSNIAVQQARYSLSLQQQKILCYLIANCIKRSDTSETWITVSIRDMYAVFGQSDRSYERAKSDFKTLRDKSWWIVTDGNKDRDVTVGFISKVEIYRNSQIIKFKWDEDMLPYLQDIKEKYTEYKLFYVLTMGSSYSVRLYELFKSVANKTIWNFKIDYLKKLLMAEKYVRFANFKQRVLTPAITEINERTDLNVTYELFKYGDSGKVYSDIEFTVSFKTGDALKKIDDNIRLELNADQCEGQQTFDDIY